MTRNGALSAKKQRVIEALLSGASVTAAAERAGVSRRTAGRYLADPLVQAALSEALDAALDQVTREAVAAMGEALETLRRLHRSEATPPGVRVRAAGLILDVGVKLREFSDLARRLAALEERVGGGGR